MQRSSSSVGQTGGWAELVSQPRSVGRALWSSFDRRGDPPQPHSFGHGSVKTMSERRADDLCFLEPFFINHFWSSGRRDYFVVVAVSRCTHRAGSRPPTENRSIEPNRSGLARAQTRAPRRRISFRLPHNNSNHNNNNNATTMRCHSSAVRARFIHETRAPLVISSVVVYTLYSW